MWTPVLADSASIAALTPARESMSVMSRSNPTVNTVRAYLWAFGLGGAAQPHYRGPDERRYART
ncbi:hypothetical protein acdb102_27440 [Acidothermaceae bacterium B102]|nr:hypothetical protein acdb102_27440 [Acidothermaceae bacterium B102]